MLRPALVFWLRLHWRSGSRCALFSFCLLLLVESVSPPLCVHTVLPPFVPKRWTAHLSCPSGAQRLTQPSPDPRGGATARFLAAYSHQKLTSLGGAAERGATRFAAGVAYFVLMETLQGVSYWYIDQCESKTNELLTVLGFLHICGQPYFTHLMCGAFYKPGGTRAIQNDFAKRIAVLGGCVARPIDRSIP